MELQQRARLPGATSLVPKGKALGPHGSLILRVEVLAGHASQDLALARQGSALGYTPGPGTPFSVSLLPSLHFYLAPVAWLSVNCGDLR